MREGHDACDVSAGIDVRAAGAHVAVDFDTFERVVHTRAFEA